MTTQQKIENIKSELIKSEELDSWKEFVDSCELGFCQNITYRIEKMNINGVETHFGEIEVDEPYYSEEADEEVNTMTHHWTTIDGEIYEFAKGTLKDYINYIDLYSIDPEIDDSRYNEKGNFSINENNIKKILHRLLLEEIKSIVDLKDNICYQYNDLPVETQQDIDVQFKIFGSNSEGDELKLNGFPEEYEYCYRLLSWKEIPKYLPLVKGILNQKNDIWYKKMQKEIKQTGLKYPAVGEEGNHRGAYYYINKMDLPYLEIRRSKI